MDDKLELYWKNRDEKFNIKDFLFLNDPLWGLIWEELGKVFPEPEIPSELRQQLDRITPQFQPTLIEAFRNQGSNKQRLFADIQHNCKLNDITFFLGDDVLELTALKFPWIPDFTVTSMSVDLAKLSVDLALKLGDLKVEGEYTGSNLALQKLLPVPHNGQIQIVYNDVTATGRVGLQIRGDSLVPENYDVLFQPNASEITFKHYTTTTEPQVKIVGKEEESEIGTKLWVEMSEVLTQALHEQLGEAIVDFSVTELMEDEDDMLREMARVHSQRANKIVDSLLHLSKNYLMVHEHKSIKTAPFTMIFKVPNSTVYQGKFETGDGYIEDLLTLSRCRDFSLYENGDMMEVYGSLYLNKFQHGYSSYTAAFGDTKITGSIKTTSYTNKIFLKLTAEKQRGWWKTSLDKLQVSTLKDFDTLASGEELSSNIWLTPKLEKWVPQQLRFEGVRDLEKHLLQAFDNSISKTNQVEFMHDDPLYL